MGPLKLNGAIVYFFAKEVNSLFKIKKDLCKSVLREERGVAEPRATG